MTLSTNRSSAGAVLVVLAAFLLGGCAASTTSIAPTIGPGAVGVSSAPAASPNAAAETYCTDKGGKLVDRVATWNTNGDPSTWLMLPGRWRLCEFESGEGDDTTRISVDLVTLSSETPTLAALAYLSKIPPPNPPQVGQNPGQYDCTAGLGGAAAFGNTAAGGGWVAADEPVFKVMSLCVFADQSAIDEFGIWYYANDIVRGADLAPLLRYQPTGPLPAVFERVRP